MKQTLIILFLFSTAHGQIAVRKSTTSTGMSLTIPVPTQSKGSLMWVVAKEQDRNLTYLNYIEKIQVKNFSLYGGAGIHLGSRQTLNWKQDANSIFLAGFSAVGGIAYQFNRFFVGMDIMPRVDLPVFGGCEMHRYCSEAKLNSVNFTIGIK
jgi:hypothetical protein